MADFTITSRGTPHTSGSMDIILTDRTTRPIIGRIRSRVERVANRPGAYDFGADADSLQFNLGCVFTTAAAFASSEDFREELADFIALFLDLRTGKPLKVQIAFSDVPGLEWDVVLNSAVAPAMLTANYGEFRVQLIAHDPFGKAPQDITSGSSVASPYTMTVTNSGRMPTPAIYRIKNTGGTTITGFTLTRTKEV